ncbi:putative dehydrogenase [Kushneria sinocarnis]|uniref:Putative dehydrogenase n=1 Tax=Kushneria sinocarnis TaxID=595502 RepID=A0A420X0I8_9GAMM|nr:Gfo/Idh/MocA family oxidoreductase [Kushneria sinocarnis]RKR07219.1 putative dehydrogenase [Kushneria sinocarnis]
MTRGHSTTPPGVRGVLIGCGFFAENQLHAWQALPGVEIVAVCDRDPARLAQVRERFGIDEGHTDAGRLLASCRPDFVDIAAPTPAHAELVELAACAGADIICQKPFAGSPAAARALIETCRHHGVSLSIHENFRWQHAIRRVIDTLRQGAIGRPFFGRISYRSGFDVYRAQPYLARAERFIIEDLGIHLLDVARALFGEVDRLGCEITRVNPDIRGEDVATMMLHHDSEVTTLVDCSYATRLAEDPFPQSLIEIDGSHGSLRLAPDYRLTRHDAAGGQDTREVAPTPPAWSTAPWTPIQESVSAFQADWLDARRGGRPVETRGEDNYNTLALVEAAYRAAADHGTVTPERWPPA